jgi:hypothetical protein
MMNSYVLNVNQLPPSQSPIQKKRMKIKDFPIRPSEVPIMLEWDLWIYGSASYGIANFYQILLQLFLL